MTKERWGCLFFGSIAAVLLFPLFWAYAEPVFTKPAVSEDAATETALQYLAESYPTLLFEVENCWYNDCCNQFWVEIDPENQSIPPFKVYLDRKGRIQSDDLKDPLHILP